MIVTKLIGGLGNQMFQYSVARSQSLRLNVPLYLDVSGFEGYKLHQGFELGKIFSLNAEIATDNDLFSVLGWQASQSVRTLIQKIGVSYLRNKSWIKEPSFYYWDGINMLPDKIYLEGYWQSECYFKDCADVIKSDFKFKGTLDGCNLPLKQKIESSNSISVHIRRGDYLSNPDAAKTHGVCSLNYYEDAMAQMSKKVESPVFFVFSDEPQWVKDNLKAVNYSVIYVENNKGENSYKDMWLMSLCKHNVIANSTFSWWGAWLNANNEKIVIAPERWFENDEMQLKAFDIYPSSWLKL